MVLVAGIAVHVMPCHDCGIYSKHLCIVYHDACETILFVCMFYNAVFVYLYLYGLWPEIKSYYYYYVKSSHCTIVGVMSRAHIHLGGQGEFLY